MPDWIVLLWTRAIYCSQQGHRWKLEDLDYCLNCGAPWVRRYTTAPGFWALSVGHSPGGWHLQLGRWVWTTES